MRRLWIRHPFSPFPSFRRPRLLVSSACALAVLALFVTVALPGVARGAGPKNGRGGAGKGGAGKGNRPAAAARPTGTSPQRPLPVYKPKRAASQSVRYEIVEGLGSPETIVVVRGDGAVRYKKGDQIRTFRLKKPQLKGLAQLIKRSSFRTLEPVYGDHALLADPKSKTVLLKFAARTESVQDFLDPEHPAPAGFHTLTDKLDKLVKRLEKVPSAKIPFSGVGITVQTDRNSYPIVPGAAAPAMWAAVAINNSGDEPLRMEFPNSQKYDFSIRDSVGEEVYRWSKGREFESKPSRLVVDKGGVHYVEEIRLTQASGAPLPPGDYTLEWRLTGSLPSAGQVPFEITEHAAPEVTPPGTVPTPSQKTQSPKAKRGARLNQAAKKHQNG
ncbi:MAG: hypothetical protein HYR85_01475 [Planctomycetes bacterium]|nr:hypothetical protein [Planctomycetota bacterium]MBI3843102.1 hypothetical protein [Planctomycetota bacterium]